MTGIEASFAHCRGTMRTSNFRHALRLLPDAERDAISAVYAFMRRCDDLSDEPGATRASLDAWRSQLHAALDGALPDHPIWPAFRQTVDRYSIPRDYFEEMIEGVSSDLTRTTVATFDELYQYCYRVASVAGLSLLHIFGNRSQDALALAEKCGVAFQLTNILRDVKEDMDRGRIYLPQEDRAKFGVEEIAESGAFLDLLRFEAKRARAYYAESRRLPSMVRPQCGRALWALIEVYARLLDRIEREGFPVLRRRVRLSTPEKFWILCQAHWKL